MVKTEVSISPASFSDDQSKGSDLPVVVESKTRLAEGVVGITLKRVDGDSFDRWSPGAHAEIVLDSGLVRTYSIYSDPIDNERMSVAVLRSADSRGGSIEISDTVDSGHTLLLQAVRNNFEHVYSDKAAYIAGGIGITPVLSHLRESTRENEDIQLLYVGRSFSRMALVDDVQAFSQNVRVVDTLVENGRQALKEFLENVPESATVYCCGPEGLLKEVSNYMEEIGASERLVMERFQADQDAPEMHQADDGSFEVELAASGKTIQVGPGASLLGQIIEAGVEAEFFCEEGYCGTCETRVLEGTPDHRDSVLSKSEKESGKVMLPCVSRALSPRLKLDK